MNSRIQEFKNSLPRVVVGSIVAASVVCVCVVSAVGINIPIAGESGKVDLYSATSRNSERGRPELVRIDNVDSSSPTIELGVIPSSKPSRFLFTPVQLGLDPDLLDSTTLKTSCDCIEIHIIDCRRLIGASRKLIEIVHREVSDSSVDASNLLLVSCQATIRGHEPRKFRLSLEVVSSPDL